MDTDRQRQETIDPDALENLETARAALRWALERLQKAEERAEGLSRQLEEADKTRARAVEEQAALQRTLALRSTETDQRELYYAKLEEFLSLKLEGKIDLAALAKRELDAAQLQEHLRQKQIHVEKDAGLRRTALERDYQTLKSELQEELRARERALDQQHESKRAALEREHLARMADVHEKEALVRQERKALEERQAHFQEYYDARHAELNGQLAHFRAEVEDQARLRAETVERMLGQRLAAAESAWAQEKALLAQELEAWRNRAREAASRAVELERAIAQAEADLDRGRAARDRLTIELESARAESKAEREVLEARLERARAVSEERLARHLELDNRLGAAEEAARRSEAAAQQQSARFEEQRKDWSRQRDELLAALKAQLDALGPRQAS